MHCSSRPPPANIALNTAPTCRRQHSIKAATHPTPIRTGKMERGGGGRFWRHTPQPLPPIFFYKEQERCAIVPSWSRGVIQISCLSGEIAIGGGIGPCFSGTCPITSPQFFAVQKKQHHEFSDIPLSLRMQCYISHSVPFMTRRCTELSKFKLGIPSYGIYVWIRQLSYSREFYNAHYWLGNQLFVKRS